MLLFLVCCQGDVDRAFLGKDTVPYQQVFRAVLVRNEPPNNPKEKEKTKDIFNLKQLKVKRAFNIFVSLFNLLKLDQSKIVE